MVLESLLHVEF